MSDQPEVQPTDVKPGLSLFDRFATAATRHVSRAGFFAICVAMVVIWLPSYFLFSSVDTWQLIINTLTTIVTFLLVALLQNSQTRSDDALQQKLNAIADALADLMQTQASQSPELHQQYRELRAAVGLELREGS